MPRPIGEQFEPEKADRIRSLAGRIRSILTGAGGIRYFCLELARTLEAGALLAAIHVASSLLELSARQLLVFSLADDSDAKTENEELFPRPIDVLEYEIEDDRRLSMYEILEELTDHGIIDESEKDKIEGFYSDIRIPIHHGITRRFVREESNGISLRNEPRSLFCGSQHARMGDLDRAIEDKSLDYVEVAVDFVFRHFGPPEADQRTRE